MGFTFFDGSVFLRATVVAAVVVVLLMAVVSVLARRTGRIAVVDTVWGLGFIAVAVSSLVVRQTADVRLSALTDANDPYPFDRGWRMWLLVVLVTVWGGRLAWHIFRRSRGAGEDPRYEELMSGGGSLFGKVLLPQGLAIWFVSMPVQLAAGQAHRLGVAAYVGVAVWLVGMVFETVGDRQLAAYRAQPRESRPPVMDRGLWRYTRHPNYFGDACVWWGTWLVVADSWPGALTILSPVAMTYFLVFATGARLLERTMMQRPGYPEYAARTSMFLPLPPRS